MRKQPEVKVIPQFDGYSIDRDGVIYHGNEVYCNPRKRKQSQVTIYPNGVAHLLTIHELLESIWAIKASRLS